MPLLTALDGIAVPPGPRWCETCQRAMIELMSDEDPDQDSFEERVRAIAREVSRSVERMADFDIDEIAEAVGVDAARAKALADSVGRWLSSQAENLGEDLPFWGALGGRAMANHPPRTEGPHPLDVPTAEQGLALSALDSGRWMVEPGSDELVTHGEGPEPSEAMGLVSELRARDWVAANGEVTLVGRNALSRWLDSSNPS